MMTSIHGRSVSGSNLSENQKSLLSALPLDISEVQDRIEDVRTLIEAGYARLTIVQKVWGTEFLIERTDHSRV